MFGPNTHTSGKLDISYSHRDRTFFNLYHSVTKKFKNTFSLKNYDILFIPGSGTVGIEAVISSLKNKVNVLGHGKFHDRWKELSLRYNPKQRKHDLYSDFPQDMYVHLETSISEIFYYPSADIVDAISSFPFYDLENPKVFVTCSNKILGSFPGLSIVGVRKDSWNIFREDNRFSYLNLFLYKRYAEKNQLPTTAPIHLFAHLEKTLDEYDSYRLKNKIFEVSFLIGEALGRHNLIGSHICPVLTFPKSVIPADLAKKYELYGLNTDSENYQIFTYSDKLSNYSNFAKDVKKFK
tara:strand:- start:92 stop:973 length:882 start_codon:yes stop_codon:yes gene_type:complete